MIIIVAQNALVSSLGKIKIKKIDGPKDADTEEGRRKILILNASNIKFCSVQLITPKNSDFVCAQFEKKVTNIKINKN